MARSWLMPWKFTKRLLQPGTLSKANLDLLDVDANAFTKQLRYFQGWMLILFAYAGLLMSKPGSTVSVLNRNIVD